MAYIFGPVPSRRLGLSLGVDLIPSKTCTYDCLYCQVGKTTCKTVDIESYVPAGDVLDELGSALKKTSPETITLAGSGEPTLHSGIGEIIEFIKEKTDTQVALLTNGSLLWREEVRDRVLDADIIMPTLSTVFEDTFNRIHRPHSDLKLPDIIGGIKRLREAYKGKLLIEIILLAGFNDSDRELIGLKNVLEEISPDKIQLNTVVRPPTDSSALALDMKKLESIKDFFGDNAEIVAKAPLRQHVGEYDSQADAIIEMTRRRPVSNTDIARILNIELKDLEGLLKGLLIKGRIRKQKHAGEVYYISA